MVNAEATGIKPAVIKEITDMARRYGVQRVILFGSRARGDFWRASDIDLAVYGGDVVRFSLDVEENTSTLLEYDIIDLSKAVDPGLMDEIKREGIILYEEV